MALQQHPIPQHIASFEFRLVGNLTLKQFGFLATGILLAWLFFIAPVHPVIKWPIAFLFGTGGITLAFVPVQGRSFDKWIWAFFKAVFAPTQRVWRKSEEHLYFLEISPSRQLEKETTISKAAVTKKLLQRYLTQTRQGFSPLDEEEQRFLKSLDFGVSLPAKVAFATGQFAEEAKKKQFEIWTPAVTPPPTPPTAPPPIPTLPTPTPEEKRTFLPGLLERERKMQAPQAIIPLASEINFVEKNVLTLPSPNRIPTYLTSIGEIRVRKLHSRPELTGEFLMPVSGEKKFQPSPALQARLGLYQEPQNKQASTFSTNPPTITTPSPSSPTPIPTTKTAPTKITPAISKEKPEKKKGVEGEKRIEEKKETKETKAAKSKIPPLTNVPNVLNGLVKDSNGRLLEGAILIVKNEAGIPVRALKTNKLGQFLIMTPLPSGHYKIETEKEGLSFDIIEFETKGEVIPPIEIYAKP